MKVSPVPAQMRLESDGAMASAPTDATPWLSKIDRQVVPASVVFQMPPDAAPT